MAAPSAAQAEIAVNCFLLIECLQFPGNEESS